MDRHLAGGVGSHENSLVESCRDPEGTGQQEMGSAEDVLGGGEGASVNQVLKIKGTLSEIRSEVPGPVPHCPDN